MIFRGSCQPSLDDGLNVVSADFNLMDAVGKPRSVVLLNSLWWLPVGESNVGWRSAGPFLFKLNDAVGEPKKPLHVFVVLIFTNGFEEEGKCLVCFDDHA